MTDPSKNRSRSHAIVPGVASAVALGPNPKRVALFLSAPAAGRYSIAIGEDAVLDRGITVLTATAGVYVPYNWYGDDLTGEVRVIASAGTTAGWIEVYSA